MPNFFVMTDAEALLIGFDFSPQMEDGDTIEGSNANGTSKVEVRNPAGQVQAGMIEAGTFDIVGQTVQARILGGTAGVDYDVSFFAATSTGDYLEGKVTARVED